MAIYTIFVNSKSTGKEYKTIAGAKKYAQWFEDFSSDHNLNDTVTITRETENTFETIYSSKED